MEYVAGRTVRDQLDAATAPWTELQIAFRVRQLLKPLTTLHSMGVSHRDITPPNVFVGSQKVLKLGDFGIPKAQLHPSGVHADVFNAAFAPKDVGTWWAPADDVFQVGLLLASLAAGEEVYWDLGLSCGERIHEQRSAEVCHKDSNQCEVATSEGRRRSLRACLRMLARR